MRPAYETKQQERVSDMSLYEFGGTEYQVQTIQKRFLRYFASCDVVLDLGCGRGIFLELLRKQGKSADGVDNSREAIEACKAKGLENVCEDDSFHYLSNKRSKYDGIFCSHLIEHLEYADALRLVDLCFEALAPRGTFVVVTPNSMDLQVLSEIFWLDPTHKRFYPLTLLKSMLRHRGFRVVREGHFLGGWAAIGKRHLPEYIFRRLLWGRYFGKPNTFVVATKPQEP